MFRVSCIQLRSTNNINQNLNKTEKLIIKAIKQKTDFIITPEVSSLFSLNKNQLLKVCKPMNEDIYLNGIKKLAKKYKKWILIGSLIIKISKNKSVSKAIGVVEIKDLIKKKINEDEVIEKISIKTRQYAKRQATWARGHMKSWRKIEPKRLNSFLKKI